MRNLPGGSTVLIVDEDMAFVWWLGDVFSEAGYQAVPALSCQQALSLCEEFALRIDVIAVDPRLAGVSEMIERLEQASPGVRVLILRDPANTSRPVIAGDATLDRPSRGEVSRAEWLRRLRQALSQLEAERRMSGPEAGV